MACPVDGSLLGVVALGQPIETSGAKSNEPKRLIRTILETQSLGPTGLDAASPSGSSRFDPVVYDGGLCKGLIQSTCVFVPPVVPTFGCFGRVPVDHECGGFRCK